MISDKMLVGITAALILIVFAIIIVANKEVDDRESRLHECYSIINHLHDDIQAYQDSLLEARRELIVWRQRPFN